MVDAVVAEKNRRQSASGKLFEGIQDSLARRCSKALQYA
jgi:hypothetical protein